MFRSNIGPGRIRLFSVIAAVTLSLFIISCQGTVSVPGSVDFGNAGQSGENRTVHRLSMPGMHPLSR
jgi:hypothetical protein